MVNAAAAASSIFVTYFANWAQYHVAPYGPYTPDKLAPIAGRLDVINYAFAYFDPSTFALTQPEPKDHTFYTEINAMKSSNPSLKVVLSVGGWNFPSAHFSSMVSTYVLPSLFALQLHVQSTHHRTPLPSSFSSFGRPANRALFIASVKSNMATYGFDGVDIDWEYPCSPPRTDYVKFSCTKVTPSSDAGGGANGTAACGRDTAGLLALFTELRTALGADAIITTASQAGVKNAALWDLKAMSTPLSWFNVMSYDYTVSDVDGSFRTAPNSPLYSPTTTPMIEQGSINTTVAFYLSEGVPASKIVVGTALYAHTWYVPGATSTPGFGANGTVQGACCGAFKTTFGAKFGKGSQLCGTYMYSEVIAAGFDVTHDAETNTDIGYMHAASGDAWTAAGVWASFTTVETSNKIASWAVSKGLLGVMAFDSSMDTIDFDTGTPTYKYMNGIADALGKPQPSPTPPGPTPPGPTPPGPSPSPPAPGQCKSISPQASDAWCNANCHHQPPNCPASLCECTPAK